MSIRPRVWVIQCLQDFSKLFVRPPEDKGEQGVVPVLVKCGFDPKMQISNRYLDVWKSANIGKIPFSDGLDLPVKASCLVDARTDEEDTPISCGRFSLTYHSLFRIFNSSQSKFLSLFYRFEQNIARIMRLGRQIENLANRRLGNLSVVGPEKGAACEMKAFPSASTYKKRPKTARRTCETCSPQQQ